MKIFRTLSLGVSFLMFMPFFLSAQSTSSGSGSPQEVVTNETLEKYLGPRIRFDSSHAVMLENHKRLELLLNAFLRGDTDTIKRLSDELTRSMSVVRQIIPQDPEQGIPAYIAIADIANQSNAMRVEISRNNPLKAYEHYSRVISSCLQCHQAVRSWGKFPLPDPQEESEKK